MPPWATRAVRTTARAMARVIEVRIVRSALGIWLGDRGSDDHFGSGRHCNN